LASSNQFDYAKPKSLKETFKILSRFKKPFILAGGTDLVEMIKNQTISPDVIVDIKGLKELNKVEFKNNILSIGAGVTFSELIESKIIPKKFPVIVELCRTVASVGIRNRATLIGNICSAVPCMDSGPLLLAYDATVIVASSKEERKIPAIKWFIDPRKTALKKGEIVKSVLIPFPKEKHAGCFLKLGRYSGEDLAQVNLLLLALKDGSFKISYGAVAPTPIRAKKIEELLNGKEITCELIEKACKMVEEEIKPITDIRASKEYRMHMAKVMLERSLKASLSRLKDGVPEYGTSLI
jgi:CO/xanthine dehydrogenase FAD-binding subunit